MVVEHAPTRGDLQRLPSDPDPAGFPFLPDETDRVLIVDTYAVLSSSVAFQLLQPISRRTVQIFRILSGV